jgi:threonine synthase
VSQLLGIRYWKSGKELPRAAANFPSEESGDFPRCIIDVENVKMHFDRDIISTGPRSLWRYSCVLPLEEPERAVSLGEGCTPLVPLRALGRELSMEQLYGKDEGRNPTGTFKDRGASVAVSRYRELGVNGVALNSSGNAGAAWGVYSARAGIQCTNVLPDDVLAAALVQSVLSGARTLRYDGPWQEAGAAVEALAIREGLLNVSTLLEPYRLEGKKTMAYEIAEQLGWSLPDAILYPVGGGVGPLAIYKGFEELQQLGWVRPGRLPRLVLVQYEGCAPIVKAFEEGRTQVETWLDLDVLPGGMKSTKPAGGEALLELLRTVGGTAMAVSTQDALDGVKSLARLEGVTVCPEAGTLVAALRAAHLDGVVRRDESVVLLLTGTALKSVQLFPIRGCPILARDGKVIAH